MKNKVYIAVAVTHDKGMDGFPHQIGTPFKTEKDAQVYISRQIAASNRWYGTQKTDTKNLVQTYAESGDPESGVAYSIIPVEL